MGTIRLVCSALVLAASVARAELRIVPEPRQVKLQSGRFELKGSITIATPSGDEEDRFAAELLKGELESLPGVQVRLVSRGEGEIVLARDPRLIQLGDEGYRIDATPSGVRVRARTSAGLFYGVQTLRQMVQPDGIPAATVEDWPALRWRGLQDDLSRGPVPTLESLKRRIATAAEYKINWYGLYMEHSFAFRSEPLIAPPGGALDEAELKELDAHARRHHVALVLEQQTLAHVDHLLTLQKFRGLAEVPGGNMLSPALPATDTLVASLIRELAPLTSAPFLHIGGDEPADLGQGQSRAMVEKLGLPQTYFLYVGKLHDLLASMGKRIMFWGDFAMKHPESLSQAPRDAIVASWNFEARESFEAYVAPFRAAQLDVVVCPGVSNWNRVFPNLDTAIPNIRRFTLEGQRQGAIGQLDCTWNDGGEALFGLVWYPALYGAAAAWQPGDCDPERFRKTFDWAFFRNPGTEMSEAIERINRAHGLVGSLRPTDVTIELSWLNPVLGGMDRQLLAMLAPVAVPIRTAQEEAIERIRKARRSATRNVDLLDEYEAAAWRLHFLADRFLWATRIQELYQDAVANQVTNRERAVGDMRTILGLLAQGRAWAVEMRALYERAWLLESRPYWLGNVLAQYDYDIATWQRRSEDFRIHGVLLRNGARLPPASQMGIEP
jgi:hypothetical protein